jgi:hypothetical protein
MKLNLSYETLHAIRMALDFAGNPVVYQKLDRALKNYLNIFSFRNTLNVDEAEISFILKELENHSNASNFVSSKMSYNNAINELQRKTGIPRVK